MRLERWRLLQTDAHVCRACPGVSPGSAVLGPLSGAVPCDLLIVGEAPGRQGAARTGIPFSGDQSGVRFELLLAAAGLAREEVLLTNAVLCLPLDAKGRNRTVLRSEVVRCRRFLLPTIDMVRPRIIATLGAVALGAVTGDKGVRLAGRVGRPVALGERLVFPLYHPGRQAELHRPWADQVRDWQAFGRLARRGSLADRAFGPETRDAVGVVAQAGEDLVGVLADER